MVLVAHVAEQGAAADGDRTAQGVVAILVAVAAVIITECRLGNGGNCRQPGLPVLDTGLFVVLHSASKPVRDIVLAKPNYSFEKRQRDLEKKRKQEEKRQRKLAEKNPAGDGSVQASPDEGVTPDTDPAKMGN